MRYKITLSYDGAPFCGWQRQPDAPSVQEALETALQTLVGEPVAVTGAGRTDTGVSAVNYVAHFDAPGELDEGYLACKLNAILPPSIAVSSVAAAAPDFHARFDARKRTYTYFLHRRKDPFLAGSSYFYGYPEVDFELMNKAAAMLVGTHDFSCFQKVGSDNKTTVCTVFEAGWQPYAPAGGALASDPVRGSAAHPSQPGGWAPPAYDAAGGTPLGGSASLADVFPIGRRIADPLRKAGFPAARDLNDLAAHPSYETASELAQSLTDAYAAGVYSKVILIYNHFVTASRQEVVCETYLPWNDSPTKRAENVGEPYPEEGVAYENGDFCGRYIVEPSPSSVAETLLPQVMRLKIYAMLLDSAAAEHAARMIAMQTATDNAQDILDELTLEYNKGRQQQITAEILDIVGGSQQ